ncbi:f98a5788-8087-46fd-b1ad-7e834f1d7abe [Thermothielavioides terrestris]|uniref:F98a5788-8087-46fd-b1ad-7e834f1d7abe n=1 Tax=Thermothielavioides terrestris TaxID=2587410 RepID=A0A3S4D6X0_9PEZI|nr:f98a5788-8087-46fd-b1ad-7e834f1d7abe [Thermothielavioides terrestris]
MDEKTTNILPSYQPPADAPQWRRQRPRRSRALRLLALGCLCFIAFAQWKQLSRPAASVLPPSPELTIHGLSVKRLQEDLATCAKLRAKPQDPIGAGRERNARYLDGHPPVLIKNASVWVGEPDAGTPAEAARNGTGYSWINADVYLEYGLIKRVEPSIALSSVASDAVVFHAHGRPLTAGIIDMHSHAGVNSLPELWGDEDTNEMASDITPYVRSIDGIQPGDHQLQVIKSGGVTTTLILPGSANNMGGEAYVIKLAVGKADGRNEASAADMLADPDRTWRFMKMACGENAKRVYGRPGQQGPTSRLGESWEFRHAFEQATKLVREQDDWCDAAAALGVHHMKSYLPQELRWESLGALLRDQVRLNTHCYTIPDLEAFVDHTNEFKFKVRAFHHAHQTFLVPEAPESATASEYAGKILYDNGLTPIYVSDNPVLNAQHVIFEAAKAYRYGLPYHAALAAVTTAPAERLGFGNRLGKIKPGFDADVVVWDSDPLSLGAAPVQVWIDGTPQFEEPVVLKKPPAELIVPDETLAKILDGPTPMEEVVFTGISRVLFRKEVKELSSNSTVVLSKGKVTCLGACEPELQAATRAGTPVIHLKNGHLTESFTAFGSKVGLNAIDAEADTDNGPNFGAFTRAEDGLALDTIKTTIAHSHGVTKAISAPRLTGHGTHHGTSHAIFASDAAVHYTLDLSVKNARQPDVTSISGAVGALRRKLLHAAAAARNASSSTPDAYSEQFYLQRVVNGSLALVVTVHSVDAIAALLRVKAAVEEERAGAGAALRLVVFGGAESHLLADELAAARVGVVLAPAFSYAHYWDQRRALTGAPLTNGTAVDRLLDAGVLTGIGLDGDSDWAVQDLGLLAGIVWRNGEGRVDERGALELVGGNLYKLLGVKEPGVEEGHFVVWEGSPLDIGGRVKAVGGGQGVVDVWN